MRHIILDFLSMMCLIFLCFRDLIIPISPLVFNKQEIMSFLLAKNTIISGVQSPTFCDNTTQVFVFSHYCIAMFCESLYCIISHAAIVNQKFFAYRSTTIIKNQSIKGCNGFEYQPRGAFTLRKRKKKPRRIYVVQIIKIF